MESLVTLYPYRNNTAQSCVKYISTLNNHRFLTAEEWIFGFNTGFMDLTSGVRRILFNEIITCKFIVVANIIPPALVPLIMQQQQQQNKNKKTKRKKK